MTLSLVALMAGCGFRAAAPGVHAIPLEIADAPQTTDEPRANASIDTSTATPAQSAPTDDLDGSAADVGGPTDETPHVVPPPATSESAPPQPIPAYLLDDAISLYLDILLLDLLIPTPIAPNPSPGGFTNLELLCRDQGIPDSVCRRRYGR